MTSNNSTMITLRGKGQWMKILGDPVPNYNRDGYEWTFDFYPDEDGLEAIKKEKLTSKLKEKGGKRYLRLTQRQMNSKGEQNKPIRVVDQQGRLWDQSKKIGNDSDIDVKIKVVDYGKGKQMGMYPQAVRVLNLVEFIPQDFEPLSEEDEFFRATNVDEDRMFRADFLNEEPEEPDLDDEIPE